MKVPPMGMSREEAQEALQRLRHPVRVVVDRTKNPFNIGTIIRTAHSFLVQEIILIGTESWYKRAAMGMHRFENITEIATIREFIEKSRAEP
ncbi:MAG: TrmH family RNA methyltransferase, partial [Myxococcota bacterium]